MRVVQQGAHLCPPVLLAAHLNCPSSSVLLTASPLGQGYFVVGKTNGDIVFFATDRGHTVRFKCAFESAVTALAAGDLRHQRKEEVVIITADGLLQSVAFPSFREEKITPPLLQFEQPLNANICAAQLIDIDGDGKCELMVVMTDRVVRTYRYVECRLAPLNKWEVPSQICGLSLGATRGGLLYALLGQANQRYVVRIDFAPCSSVTVQQSMALSEWSRASQLDVPINPVHVTLIGTISSKLLVVNSECNTETELKNVAGDIVCISAVTLSNGLRLLVTIDMRGVMLVYGWLDNLVPETQPLVRCAVLAEVEHLSAMATDEDNVLLVGLSSVYCKIAIYKIDLSSVVRVSRHQ